MAVPLYKYVVCQPCSIPYSIQSSAELAPPEVRGSLVALQQLSIATGIMVSFWIDYGTNFIGGTGVTQSEAAWRVPIALQLVPAMIVGVGILFMPFSPRYVRQQSIQPWRELIIRIGLCVGIIDGYLDKAVRMRLWQSSVGRGICRLTLTLSKLSSCEDCLCFCNDKTDVVMRREIKAEHLFEVETSQMNFPQFQDGTFISEFKLGLYSYLSLLTSRSTRTYVCLVASLICYYHTALLYRALVGTL